MPPSGYEIHGLTPAQRAAGYHYLLITLAECDKWLAAPLRACAEHLAQFAVRGRRRDAEVQPLAPPDLDTYVEDESDEHTEFDPSPAPVMGDELWADLERALRHDRARSL
jgi:hypothetical protein